MYLREQTAKSLIEKICAKSSIDPTAVKHMAYINSDGLVLMVDDKVVQNLPNEQALDVEFISVTSKKPNVDLHIIIRF